MKEEEEFLFPLTVARSFNTMMKLRAKGYGKAAGYVSS